MKRNEKINIFISYSHRNEDAPIDLSKHLSPLKNAGQINVWFDKKVKVGQDFQSEIDEQIYEADIICLLLSSDFLDSEACRKEMEIALNLLQEKNIHVVPVILSPCGWLDDGDINKLLALPTDGKEISSYSDKEKGWNIVYEGIKEIVADELELRRLKISPEFRGFLISTEILSRAHSHKKEVLLDDIFIHPELSKFDKMRNFEEKISLDAFFENIYKHPKTLIAGENQSGKTAVCKKLFIELRKRKLVPIYLSDPNYHYHGKIHNRIIDAAKEQYTNIDLNNIDKQRIVPIVDDFHFAKNKIKHIDDLSEYKYQIIVVDDIYNLNIQDENLLGSFIYFKLEELSPTRRNRLIKKWTQLSDKREGNIENELYRSIDETTNLVDSTLGKVFGSGIMPAYPFFILSVISSYELISKPLDQEITSQGYCYQALIYIYLSKQNVKNVEIDTYINFLSEFAFYFYIENRSEISKKEFETFVNKYLEKYNLPIELETLLEKLKAAQLIAFDNFGNYRFCYKYLYYFFVAKYLAENIDEKKTVIDDILSNLHLDENAYISIFISHHSKSDYLLDELTLNAMLLFGDYESAKLSNKELAFFDEQADIIANAVLPLTSPEVERERRLSLRDVEENNINDKSQDEDFADPDNNLSLSIRRAIKTVEVMGQVIRNRAGSLSKSRLEDIFEQSISVHLRILTSFFEYIQEEEQQQEIIQFIADRLELVVEDEGTKRAEKGKRIRKPSKEELESIAKTIFWNTNFYIIYGIINKIISSTGSNQLIDVVEKVCSRTNTPASELVMHGILMWYSKNLQVDNIAESIDRGEFSNVAKKVMRHLIVNHCSMHKVSYKEKQRIQNKFGIPKTRLLMFPAKGEK